MPESEDPIARENMTLLAMLAIQDPKRRAAALYFSHEFRPDDPLAVKLAKSVALPEAGVWGANVQVKLTEMQKTKPRRRRAKAARSEVLPNLFLTLLDLEDEAAKGVPDSEQIPTS